MRGQRAAVSAAFFCFGTVTGTLVPRMPAFKESLHLSDGQVGVAFLAYAVGAVAGAVLVRAVIGRGARRWVRGGTIAMMVTLVTPALAPSFVLLAASFLVLGVWGGFLDVLENSQAAELEREAGRPMINGFHGFWSLGGIAGAVVAAAAASAGISPLLHFAVVAAVVIVASVPLLAGLPDTRGGATTMIPSGTTRWRVGAAVSAVAAIAFFGILVESAGSDWGPIYLRDYGHAALGVAASVGAAFSVAMTIVRFTADRLTAQTSPAVVAALGALVSAAGVGLAMAVTEPVAAMVGFSLVGAGSAVLVPLAFSAAANLGRTGTALVVVTGAGYAGSIVGPFLIGVASDRVGLRTALAIPLLAAAAVLAFASGLRPVTRRTPTSLERPSELVIK